MNNEKYRKESNPGEAWEGMRACVRTRVRLPVEAVPAPREKLAFLITHFVFLPTLHS